MVNHIIATDMTDSKTEKWRQKLIESMSPINSPGSKGILINEIKFWHVRVYSNDEKKLCEKYKTFNNHGHTDKGEHRAWNHLFNFFTDFARGIIGLGVFPRTPSFPIPTDGHVFLMARIKDKKRGKREMR